MTETTNLRITGMTCDHCARTIEETLNALPGVRARVSFAQARAEVVTPNRIPADTLIQAICSMGYGAEPIREEAPPTGSGRTPSIRIAILGSGSAAFACAIRAARAGAQVTMIEEGGLGGTCVNVGCVPSKILIRSAQIAHEIEHHPFSGISRSPPLLNRMSLLAQHVDGRPGASRRCHINELWQARAVASGIHVFDRGAQVIIDPDCAVALGFDSESLEIETLGIGKTPGGYEQAVSRDPLARKFDFKSAARVGNRPDRRAGLDAQAFSGQMPCELSPDRFVFARQDVGFKFDQGDLRAQAKEGLPELEPDRRASENHEMLGTFRGTQRLRRGPVRMIPKPRHGRDGGPRPRRDKNPVRLDRPGRSIDRMHGQRMG